MRTLRLILYFCVGLLLGSVSVLSIAETLTLTSRTGVGYYYPATPNSVYATPDAAWLAAFPTRTSYRVCATNTAMNGSTSSAQCVTAWPGGAAHAKIFWWSGYWTNDSVQYKSVYECPPGQNWTLNGSTCTRPDCVAPEVRDPATGLCSPPACPTSGTGTGTNEDQVSPAFPNLYGWYDPVATTTKGGAGSYCSSGCTVAFQATVCVQSTQPGTNNCAALNTTYTGATCTGTTAPIVAGTTAKPPCAQGEGVVTMGGKVACVPTGASPDVPKVSKSSSTQTFPDGSTKITNTTTTCSGVGACSTTTTVTNTSATTGPNAGGAGQAGDPGTTTDEEDSVGDDETSFCAKNPDLQVCKGGIAEEGTQKQVLQEVKKLTSVDANTDKTAITNTSKYAETPGYQAAKDADDNLVKYASGVTKNGEVEAAKTTFEQALSSGFWTDIPSASCTTPTYVIAGHEIEWDRWCEIVGMIQEIGAYGMWVMLAISIFVMLSGGRQA